MPTFERCPKTVEQLAREILSKFETHAPVLDAGVKIDFVFAYGDRDERDNLTSDALTKNGIRALGITRAIPLKDRALGRGDAEISLDGDWWKDATDEERAGLLDHELHHIELKHDKAGNIQFDDLGRPKLRMRKHDYEFGWFKVIASRHGNHSLERIYARTMMADSGQYFWPDLFKTEGEALALPGK